jgi:hypothetical protein
MGIPTIFGLCTPREDVRAGTSSDADYAADLAQVVRDVGANPGEFINPSLIPTGGVRVAAFDGENADPAIGAPQSDCAIAILGGVIDQIQR